MCIRDSTDAGDLPLTENTAQDDAAIRRHVVMLHEDGEVPLALGGDHAAVSYTHLTLPTSDLV